MRLVRKTNKNNKTSRVNERLVLWDVKMVSMIILVIGGSYLRCVLSGCIWFGFWVSLNKLLQECIKTLLVYLKKYIIAENIKDMIMEYHKNK